MSRADDPARADPRGQHGDGPMAGDHGRGQPPRPSAPSSSGWRATSCASSSKTRRRPARTACRTASTGPSTPRRPWPSTTPSCASSTTCPRICGPASPSPARRTRPSVRFSNAAGIAASPTTSPTCAAWRCGSQVVDEEVARPAGDQLPGLARAQRPPVRGVRQGHRRRHGSSQCSGIAAADPAVRPARDDPDAAGTSRRRARQHRAQRRHRDVLEPRRDALGPGPGGALPAAPGAGAAPAPTRPKTDPNYLSTEAARRLARGRRSRFELCIQRYVDERSTPIEDTAVAWKERVSPAEPVAVLTLARGRPEHGRRAGAARGSSTRWPSTRGTRPTSSGRSAT